jgi:hypothetical protein
MNLQAREKMPSSNSKDQVQPMTVEAASNYASRLVEMEMRGSDTESALARLEARYGLSPHAIMHLRSRRAKSCDVGLFARLRMAYLDLCERQVTKLQHQIAVEKATGDDDLTTLEAEARALAAKIATKKAAAGRRDGGLETD